MADILEGMVDKNIIQEVPPQEAAIGKEVPEEMGSETHALINIEEISIVLDRIIPKQISYVLLKCGTLIYISQESLNKVCQLPPAEYTNIFNSMEKWDYPEHRFSDLNTIRTKNNEYLAEFLNENSMYTYRDKVYFQLALRYMSKCGYAYPGSTRSDRKIDTPIPLDMIHVQENEHIDDHVMDQVMSLYRDFLFCSWSMCPGMFNSYLSAHADPEMGLDTVSKVLADLHRYDFIWPRFHCIRVGIDEDDTIKEDFGEESDGEFQEIGEFGEAGEVGVEDDDDEIIN
jgi:hypothetical protein